MKTAIYVRVSTNMQVEEGYSLDAQIDKCKAYAVSQDWEIAEIYVEEGESAKDLNRTEVKRMLSDAANGLFDVLLVYRLDRLTRSVSDLYKMLDTLESYGVKFKSATELYDTTSAMGKLFITLVAALAEWELNNLRERVQFGMGELVRQGKWPGGPVPYGYHWDGETMHIVPEEASIIRELRRLYMTGSGFRGIAKTLNARGLLKRNGELWSGNMVGYTLENAFYAGKIRYGGKDKKGKYARRNKDRADAIWSDTDYPKIFTWEEYEEQNELRKRRELFGTSTKTEYWFVGVLRCARCGRTMSARFSQRKRTDGTKYDPVVNYICSGRDQGSGCTLPMLRQTVATDLIMDHAKTVKLSQEEVAASGEDIKREMRNIDTELDDLRKELRTISERRKKWQYMFAEDLMNESDFRSRKREEDAQEGIITMRIDELKAMEIGATTHLVPMIIEMADMFAMMQDGEKKELMQSLFESIFIDCDVYTGANSKKKGQTLPFRITDVTFN